MGHWYTKEGEPMHFIVGANGKERDTTLRDARKLHLRPSVTGVDDILDKPGLDNAVQGLLIKWCYNNPPEEYTLYMENGEPSESLEDYIKRAKTEPFKEWEEAKLRGNEVHDCLEGMWKGAVSSDDYPDGMLTLCSFAKHEIIDYCQTDNFTPEKTVAGDGYGGMIDLHNDDFVIDYKTKDITDKQWDDYEAGKNPRLAYPEMACQLAAYETALPLTKTGPRRCINVFIDRQLPGRVIIHEWKPEEIEHAWREFSACLTLWQLKKHYVPES